MYAADGGVMICGLIRVQMEPQTAYCIPDEDGVLWCRIHRIAWPRDVITNHATGKMMVHAATQWPDSLNGAVANVLGVPVRAVRASTRRAGGGFGGKNTHCIAVASCCALAAQVRVLHAFPTDGETPNTETRPSCPHRLEPHQRYGDVRRS